MSQPELDAVTRPASALFVVLEVGAFNGLSPAVGVQSDLRGELLGAGG